MRGEAMSWTKKTMISKQLLPSEWEGHGVDRGVNDITHPCRQWVGRHSLGRMIYGYVSDNETLRHIMKTYTGCYPDGA